METKHTPAEFLEKKYNGTIPELWMRQGFTTAAHVMENMRDYSADLLAKVSEQQREIESLRLAAHFVSDDDVEANLRNQVYQQQLKVSEQSQRIRQLEAALREAMEYLKNVQRLWIADNQPHGQCDLEIDKIEALLKSSS